MRILLTGGGTAGHVWPIILIGQSLQRNKRVKILYVGSRQGIETELIKKYPLPFRAIIVGKKRAYFSLFNYWDFLKTLIGIIQALGIIVYFRPEVIFSKGGYVAIPFIFWLKFFKIPLVIHESDAVMGQANLWAAKKAYKICLGFPLEYYNLYLPLKKFIYTGIPVHQDFFQTPVKTGQRLKILITGGSQGSSKINNLILAILPELLKKYDIWHLAGKRDLGKFLSIKHPYYHLFDFSLAMPKLMRDADLIISRAGAGTLAEISATGKPSIIIPLETAKGEHQRENAQIYQKNNAAVVLSEKKLTDSSLLSIINNLMADEKLRSLLGHHAHSLCQIKASEEIIDVIFESYHIKKL